ncbi:MAG: hypothetical protein ACRD18_12590 [Terriglobia bacterium]
MSLLPLARAVMGEETPQFVAYWRARRVALRGRTYHHHRKKRDPGQSDPAISF